PRARNSASTRCQYQPTSPAPWIRANVAIVASTLRAERPEPLIDHERRPEDRLREDRPDVFPERVGLLPEVEQRAEDPDPVEGPAARGRPRAALAHRRPPPSSVLCRGYLDASRVISEPDPRDQGIGSFTPRGSFARRKRTSR